MSILSLPGRKSRQSDIIFSTLLPEVFAKFQTHTCINLLDVGVGSRDTLEYLGQYPHCKVYFLDLAGSLDDASFTTFKEPFKQYGGALFDICLFWDLLYCLSAAQLEDLSITLEGLIYSETKVHSIANLSQPGEQFRIFSNNQIKVVRGNQESTQCGQSLPLPDIFAV